MLHDAVPVGHPTRLGHTSRVRLESEPALMEVRTSRGVSPLFEALVVVLHDGRPGFSTRIGEVRHLDGRTLVLTGGRTLTGTANVLRSGAPYEEVRGRTREAEGRLARLRRREDDAVVVLDLDLPQEAQQEPQANRD